MRISINWLRELVKVAQSPQELAELLTIAGIEVEDIEDRREWAKGVVIGKIIDRQPHPNADKLSVCQVDIGQENPSTIVCGAPNARADILVPVATLGTHLPKINLTIKPAKLRGVKSERVGFFHVSHSSIYFSTQVNPNNFSCLLAFL